MISIPLQPESFAQRIAAPASYNGERYNGGRPAWHRISRNICERSHGAAEGMMETTRRFFLRMAGPLAVLLGASAPLLAALSGQQAPTLPGLPEDGTATLDPKAAMKEDQKNMRKDVEKLFALAQELKEQVEKTNPSAVLSLALVRKAEEIEKLAHQIQKLAKG
jgi:hypothetical protein